MSFLLFCGLHFAMLRGARLHFAMLRGARLHFAMLRGARLHFAMLRGARLHFAMLRGARLHFAMLRGARLHFAMLRGARLHFAMLRGARLHFAMLRGARLHFAMLRGARPDGTRTRPQRCWGCQSCILTKLIKIRLYELTDLFLTIFFKTPLSLKCKSFCGERLKKDDLPWPFMCCEPTQIIVMHLQAEIGVKRITFVVDVSRKLLKYPDCAGNYSIKMISFKIQPFSLRLTSLIPCLASLGRQVSWLPSGSRLRSRLVRHNDLRLQHQPRFFSSFLIGE